MNMSIFGTFLILGVLQGAIMGGVLLAKSKSKPALFYLALAIFALTATLLRLSLFESTLDRTGALFAVPLASDLLILPLFWCFTLRVINQEINLSSRGLPWFLPWFVFFSYSLVFYLLALFEPTLEAKNTLALDWEYQNIRQFEDYITGPFNTVLGGIIVWKLFSHIHLIKDWVPDHLNERLKIYQIFLLMASLALIAVFSQFLSLYFLERTNAAPINKTAQLFYVAMVYVVGFLGYQFTALPRFKLDSDIAQEVDAFTNEEKTSLKSLFERGAYLDPNLNLNTVSRTLGLSANKTSSLIKAISNKNFRAYVNEHRVNAVKDKLQDPENAQYSILSLALECGFKSEASFYRAFKELTGSSPSEFKKLHQTQKVSFESR